MVSQNTGRNHIWLQSPALLLEGKMCETQSAEDRASGKSLTHYERETREAPSA